VALKRNERYPGRFDNPSTAHPQGAFKNRTSPTSQDGSYLEADWANDWDGFFSALLSNAGLSANGNVDSATASQYFTALRSLFLSRTSPGSDLVADNTNIQFLNTIGVVNNIVDQGSNANGSWRRYRSGAIEMWGVKSPDSAGNATVTLPLTLPAVTNIISLSQIIDTSGPAIVTTMLRTGTVTTTSFQTFTGTVSSGSVVGTNSAFVWELKYNV